VVAGEITMETHTFAAISDEELLRRLGIIE
jgi:hypothetical protein